MAETLEDLLARVAVLEKEKEERSKSEPDPTTNALRAVRDHLAVRAGMLPNHDVSDLVKRAEELAIPLNSSATEAFRFAVDRYVDSAGPVAHEFAYVQNLAGELHQAALDGKVKSED